MEATVRWRGQEARVEMKAFEMDLWRTHEAITRARSATEVARLTATLLGRMAKATAEWLELVDLEED